jgi:hypothetical protein
MIANISRFFIVTSVLVYVNADEKYLPILIWHSAGKKLFGEK